MKNRLKWLYNHLIAFNLIGMLAILMLGWIASSPYLMLFLLWAYAIFLTIVVFKFE